MYCGCLGAAARLDADGGRRRPARHDDGSLRVGRRVGRLAAPAPAAAAAVDAAVTGRFQTGVLWHRLEVVPLRRACNIGQRGVRIGPNGEGAERDDWRRSEKVCRIKAW